jgi:hypothetical protein
VLAQAPSENARARARRSHHENWLVGWSGSGRVHLLLVAEHRAKTIYLAKRIFFDREFVPWNKVVRDLAHYCSFESQEMIGGSEFNAETYVSYRGHKLAASFKKI